jgi:hypothetical protein
MLDHHHFGGLGRVHWRDRGCRLVAMPMKAGIQKRPWISSGRPTPRATTSAMQDSNAQRSAASRQAGP